MIVTDKQVASALAYWGQTLGVARGAPDKITLPKECSKLTDLLATMWFNREEHAQVPNTHWLAALIVGAHGLQEESIASHTDPRVCLVPAENGWRLGGDDSSPTPSQGEARPPLGPEGPQGVDAGGAEAPTPSDSDGWASQEMSACPMRNNGNTICEACQ